MNNNGFNGFFKAVLSYFSSFLVSFYSFCWPWPITASVFFNNKRIPSNVCITLVNSSFLHALPNEIAVSYPDYGSG